MTLSQAGSRAVCRLAGRAFGRGQRCSSRASGRLGLSQAGWRPADGSQQQREAGWEPAGGIQEHALARGR